MAPNSNNAHPESEYNALRDSLLRSTDCALHLVGEFSDFFSSIGRAIECPPEWNSSSGKISQADSTLLPAMSHLKRIKGRLLDSCSKILVTGDLNSGKSTFINALLRQPILPTDQQPCTAAFCEVSYDGSERPADSIEIHALPSTAEYDPSNSQTFHKISLEGMQALVADDGAPYCWYKIFLTSQQSSSDNSKVLIDSPGLNTDFIKTVSLFTRQQDIDVIVFLINAPYHLTLSGREFLREVAKEKPFVFIVVNKTDELGNLERCRRSVLAQLQEILPQTAADSSDLVHFVSVRRYLQHENDATFGHLLCSLEKFLVEQRAKSKLLPGRTFLVNLTNDLLQIATHNQQNAKSQLQKTETAAAIAKKQCDRLASAQEPLELGIRQCISESGKSVFDFSTQAVNAFLRSIPLLLKRQEWKGVLSFFSHLQDLRSTVAKEAKGAFHANTQSCLEVTSNSLYTIYGLAATILRDISTEDGEPTVHPDVPGLLTHLSDGELQSQLQTAPSISLFELVCSPISALFKLPNAITSASIAMISTAVVYRYVFKPLSSLIGEVFGSGSSGLVAAIGCCAFGVGGLLWMCADAKKALCANAALQFQRFYLDNSAFMRIPLDMQSAHERLLCVPQADILRRYQTLLRHERQHASQLEVDCQKLARVEKFLIEASNSFAKYKESIPKIDEKV